MKMTKVCDSSNSCCGPMVSDLLMLGSFFPMSHLLRLLYPSHKEVYCSLYAVLPTLRWPRFRGVGSLFAVIVTAARVCGGAGTKSKRCRVKILEKILIWRRRIAASHLVSGASGCRLLVRRAFWARREIETTTIGQVSASHVSEFSSDNIPSRVTVIGSICCRDIRRL